MLDISDSGVRPTKATASFERLPGRELLLSLETEATVTRRQDGEVWEDIVSLSLYSLAFDGVDLADLAGQQRAFRVPGPPPRELPSTNCYDGMHQFVTDNRVRIFGVEAGAVDLEWRGTVEDSIVGGEKEFRVRATFQATESEFSHVCCYSFAAWSKKGPDDDELYRLGKLFEQELAVELAAENWFEGRPFNSVTLSLHVEDRGKVGHDFDDAAVRYKDEAFRLRFRGKELAPKRSDRERIDLMKSRARDALKVLADGARPAPLPPERFTDWLPEPALERFRNWFSRVPQITNADREWCRGAAESFGRSGLELQWWAIYAGFKLDEALRNGDVSEECFRGFSLVLRACRDAPSQTKSSRRPGEIVDSSTGNWAATGIDDVVDLGLSGSEEASRWAVQLLDLLEQAENDEVNGEKLTSLERELQSAPQSSERTRALSVIARFSR